MNCASITSGIGFSPGGANADWIKPVQQDLGDYKSMQISAAPPNPGSGRPDRPGDHGHHSDL